MNVLKFIDEKKSEREAAEKFKESKGTINNI